MSLEQMIAQQQQLSAYTSRERAKIEALGVDEDDAYNLYLSKLLETDGAPPLTGSQRRTFGEYVAPILGVAAAVAAVDKIGSIFSDSSAFGSIGTFAGTAFDTAAGATTHLFTGYRPEYQAGAGMSGPRRVFQYGAGDTVVDVQQATAYPSTVAIQNQARLQDFPEGIEILGGSAGPTYSNEGLEQSFNLLPNDAEDEITSTLRTIPSAYLDLNNSQQPKQVGGFTTTETIRELEEINSGNPFYREMPVQASEVPPQYTMDAWSGPTADAADTAEAVKLLMSGELHNVQKYKLPLGVYQKPGHGLAAQQARDAIKANQSSL